MFQIFDSYAHVPGTHHDMQIMAFDPGPESILVLVERVDGDQPFKTEMSLNGAFPEAVPDHSRSGRAKLHILRHVERIEAIRVRITTESPGWFRTRILRIRQSMAPPCLICKKGVSLLVSAICAAAGFPLPDLEILDIEDFLGVDLTGILFGDGLLRQLLADVHPDLPDILGDILRHVDMVRRGLAFVYAEVCRRLGFCA